MATAFRVAFCSVDPIGLTTFDAFDPDSFSVATAIADGLVYVDSDGQVQPALALSWERTSATSMDFVLRPGVYFHDGSEFDARDVVATFEAHRAPTASACGGGILAPIVGATALGRYRVRIETAFPDGLLLRRLFFGLIYPKSVLRSAGREALTQHPIGAGAYRFVEWNRGQEIVLERHPEHFARVARIERLHICIGRQKSWVDKLAAGQLDVAFNLDAHDVVRAKRMPGLCVGSRPGSSSQAFLLRNAGPLADVRVRRALNHAVHRRILVELTEHGMGSPQRTVSTPREEGHAEGFAHRYSPDLARRLLEQAGFGGGFVLRGLVCETSSSLYFAVREFLARIGVELTAEIVPLSDWMKRVVLGNLSGSPYTGDFAVTSMGNPLHHALFLQFANIFSQGPGSLTRDPEYDAAFLKAASVIEPSQSLAAVQELEEFASERAYMLFTVNQFAHAAWREGVSAVVPLSAMPKAAEFWALRREATSPDPEASSPASAPGASDAASPGDTEHDLALLLEGTSHTGTFYLRPDAELRGGLARRVWANVLAAQERGRLQNEPLLRELVSLVDTRDHLSTVLDSTQRVAIVGYNDEGRCLFESRGYQALIGSGERPVMDRLPSTGDCSWPSIRRVVDTEGSWSRSVDIERGGSYHPFFLTVTQAVDDEGVPRGYTFVFSDFSGEDERLKNAAIRTILDHVPYALFACDAKARVLPGYSAACQSFFRGATVEGTPLPELLGLGECDAEHFSVCYEQLIEDLLPSELNLDQLPKRLRVGDRVCALQGAVMRSNGAVSGVLFTLLDVTDLAQAEREAERLRGVVHVLGFRSSFEAVVRRFDADLGAMLAALQEGRFDPVEARRLLHTAKGDFGQFKLDDLAASIHRVEDARPLGAPDLTCLRTLLRDTLDANEPLWNIQLESSDPAYSIHESTLAAMESLFARASSLEEARALFLQTCERVRRKPIGELLGPLERSCQDHAARVGKRVRMASSGLETLAPLRLERALGTIVHLARNAIDHALEPPEERGNKPEVGQFGISAREERGALLVEVFDDGRGIDAARVVERAEAAGLIPATSPAGVSRESALELIFQDGVSTSDAVTETSGRGVGLAAVKHEVEAAGGTLSVKTVLGLGTRFVMRFPMTPGERLHELEARVSWRAPAA
jgi:ABC-type transport system substrate-binding protein/signal transduction histidine kinase